MGLGVRPQHRRRGVGGKLLDLLIDRLKRQGARRVQAQVYEESGLDQAAAGDGREPGPPHPAAGQAADSTALLIKRGFRPYQRKLHLVQEVASLPPVPEDPIRRCEAMGITFTTLPGVAADPDWQRRIHDLYADACQDMPVGETAPQEYVGLSYACRDPNRADVLAQHFTGVRRDLRGLGIALALKCLVTRYAQQNAYRQVTTATQEANAAMLAVNRRLGFRVAYSHLRLERLLGHSRSLEGV